MRIHYVERVVVYVSECKALLDRKTDIKPY